MKNINELIIGCKQGSRGAQHEFFKATGPKMLALCRRYCKNNDDAHDALQEGFIKVFKSIEQYRGDSAIETWMGRIFINTAIDHYKKGVKYGDMFMNMNENFDYADEEDVDTESGFPCSAREIISIMDDMPDGYRVIFNLYCIEGYPHAQIADTLGISVGTSKSQYSRAKKFIYGELLRRKVINA